ncbi:hypothetical protein EON83_20880 [bacterium]|nr:MAG: hypothetical protein EON83_20880 [bacterium]
MSTFDIDELVDLDNQVTEVSGWRVEQPRPEEATVSATEEALGFQFPPTFRHFIANSRYYAGITQDVNRPLGLVWFNRLFHGGGDYYLPDFLILFMGGHDGACYCFDSRFRDESGECPVVYWDAEEMGEQDVESLHSKHMTFVQFLESIVDNELKRL